VSLQDNVTAGFHKARLVPNATTAKAELDLARDRLEKGVGNPHEG